METEWVRQKWEHEHEKRLLAPGLSPPQRGALARLDVTWGLKRQSLKTRSYKLGLLKIYGLWLGKPFEEATKQDVERFIVGLQHRVRPVSVEGYKRVLKVTYKDLLRPNRAGHPPIVNWIRLANPFNETKRAEDLLTADEVIRIASAALTVRDRAMILVLEESAARLTELIAAKIRDVRFDKYGALLTIGGDTDNRQVRLIHSVPDLGRWLNEHPHRNNPEAPLWVANAQHGFGPLGICSVKHALRSSAKRAGITKRVHPHLLRHTRINVWLDKYNDDTVKYLSGWSKNSMMVQVYRHRSGKRFDRVILEREGLLEKEHSGPVEVRSKPCPRCRTSSGPADVDCPKCTLPLSEGARAEESRIQEKVLDAWPTILRLLENPEVRKILSQPSTSAAAKPPEVAAESSAG